MQQGKTDKELGKRVQEHLHSIGLETLVGETNYNAARQSMQDGVGEFLEHMGLDASSPALTDTPRRVAKMFIDDLCWGLEYQHFPLCTAFPNGERIERAPFASIDKGKYDQMVRLKNCQTISLCEHHLQTIYGVAHIAYIPHYLTIGVSKLARVNEFFSRRPQIQERLTEQVFAALCFILQTDDVAVVHDCAHFCMKARGAMQQETVMRTDRMGGRFLSNPALRQEFFHGL